MLHSLIIILMRAPLAIVFVLAVFGHAEMAQGAAPSCPATGSTSPDGSTIVAQPTGSKSCVLTDRFGVTYQFVGSNLCIQVTSCTASFTNWTINAGGYGTSQLTCEVRNGSNFNYYIYRENGGAIGPMRSAKTLPNPQPFKNTTTSTNYADFRSAMYALRSGQTLVVGGLQPGGPPIWMGGGRENSFDGATVQITAGSSLGCAADSTGAAIIYLSPDSGPSSNFTLTGSDTASNIGYYRSGPCFQPAYATKVTIRNLIIHDCYMGIVENTTGPEANGAVTSGSNTLTNLTIPESGSYIPTTMNGINGWAVGLHIWDRDGHLPYSSNITITAVGTNTATLSTLPTFTSGTSDATDTFIVDAPVTITNVVFSHNGSWSGNSPTQNVYLGWLIPGNLSRLIWTNSNSYCQDGAPFLAGFPLKTRFVGGTVTGSVFAGGIDPIYHRGGCTESAVVDMSCGGNYTFGGTTTGTGNVFEIGPDIGNPGSSAKGYDVFRYDRDAEAKQYCGEVGYAPAMAGTWTDQYCNDEFNITTGCAVLIQNAIIINDSVVNLYALTVSSTNVPPAGRIVIKNSKFIQNTTTGAACTDLQSPSPCGLFRNVTMGSGNGCTIAGTVGSTGKQYVIDGGGNTCYASRSAAGLAAYPALPPPP